MVIVRHFAYRRNQKAGQLPAVPLRRDCANQWPVAKEKLKAITKTTKKVKMGKLCAAMLSCYRC